MLLLTQFSGFEPLLIFTAGVSALPNPCAEGHLKAADNQMKTTTEGEQLSMARGCQKPGCHGPWPSSMHHGQQLMGQSKMLHPGEGSRTPAHPLPIATR